MKVLITGGAGYIGSVIVNRMLQNNLKVRAIDALWYEKKIPFAHLENPDYEFKRIDITNGPLLNECLDGVDFVIHTAAVVGEPAGKKFPELTYNVNYKASLELINKLRKKKRVKGFVFLSTCSNYGKSERLMTENAPLRPLSLYAETKVNVEKYLMDEIKDLDWVICRLSTTYGSSPRMRFDLTVNDFTINALINKCLDIYLPHTYRPYIHVFDVAEIILKIIENFDKVKNNIFNIGFEGENYQKIKIAEIVKKFIPDMSVMVSREGADPRDYQVDFSKLQRYLNIQKTHSVEDGVKEIMGLFNSGLIKNYSDRKYYNTYPNLNGV